MKSTSQKISVAARRGSSYRKLTCVRQSQSQNGLYFQQVAAVSDVFGQERQSRITLVPHPAVDQTERQKGAGFHVLVCTVQILVYRRQASVYIPKMQETQGGSRADLAVFSVAVFF